MGRGVKHHTSHRNRLRLAACIVPGATSSLDHRPVCHRPSSSPKVLCLAKARDQQVRQS